LAQLGFDCNADMVSNDPLLDNLADALPTGLKLRVYHISTRPTPSSALFSAVTGQPEEPTRCESHFLSIASPRDHDARDEILVYAIEVLIFTTARLTNIFVSKADSSGFSHLLKKTAGSASIIRTITTSFLEFIINSRPKGAQLVLSLFARSQSQYLFPGSIENAEKHVLDDRQLIKWWCRTLDPIVRGQHLDNTQKTSLAHVIVPGCDKGETRVFFPATARQDPPGQAKWICSYPVNRLAEDVTAPLRSLIPRLPDDPKARFLDDLDGEHIDDQGQWRSVRSLDQFWEMMSYRQECSAGRLVGFIWVVFGNVPRPAQITDQREAKEQPVSLGGQDPLPPIPDQSQVNSGAVDSPTALDSTDLDPTSLPRSPLPLSSLLPPQLVRSLEATANTGSQAGAKTFSDVEGSPPLWSEEGRGELVITANDYDTLMQHLLELDFAGQEQAMKETRSWISKAAGLAKTNSWGRLLEGRCTKNESAILLGAPNGQQACVNVLTGVRKKRKAEAMDTGLQSTPLPNLATPGILAVALGSGLVRKKPKA
jgi:regulator of Ty1 transposition protein 109